ncbi:hypothetical protein [Candidatus Poriferisodalis sp.]|uniref:hypothetical protein n=1 Tax=Candidatus Poriferisodalis sp. TaxID=3101277 RepID=UPI003B024F98
MTRLSDGKPIHGDLVAVIDESSPEAGGGIYYIVAAVVIFDWPDVRERVENVVGGRTSHFHYRSEGREAIGRMAAVLEESGALASVLWRSVGRRHQVEARRDLLAVHARQLASDGVSHLIIESGDEATDQRDQDTLLDTFAASGVPFSYDWRSKSEPLLWTADAACGIASEFLLGSESEHFDRLADAGTIEVTNG